MDPRRLAAWLAGFVLVAALLHVLWPMLSDFSTYGFHDWDAHSSYRYATVQSLRHGEGPWWHPNLCGGVPSFGNPEGATNFLSPYLPLYLLFDLRAALRMEVLGHALLALAGTYLFAGQLTRSVALRALLAALFVLNGRWAFQAAVGHTWHLQYALLPWAFYFFEKAQAAGRGRYAIGAGVALALECLWGGVYPLPQTALLLGGYALLSAAFSRSLRPLALLALAGAVALGLAAPKLFAVLDQMRNVPRLIESDEVIGPWQLFVMLTAPDQRYGEAAVSVPAYQWHEWALYVAPLGFCVLALGLLFGRGKRGNAFKLLGLLCLLLGFGAFHPYSPWALLHHLPLFASQHVPSRFHYPMLLMLGAAFLTLAGPFVERLGERRPWLDLALLVPVAACAGHMAYYSRTPFEQSFWMRAPEGIVAAPQFEHVAEAPLAYEKPDFARPMLLAMFANQGVMKCYGQPEFPSTVLPVGDPDYRGLAYVDGDEGQAKVVRWSPNAATVEVTGAAPGAVVVYDMNYDESWRANGKPAIDYGGLVAARLSGANGRIRFRYFPRTLRWSLPLFCATLLACVWRRRWTRVAFKALRGGRAVVEST
jgi:hypothetical protein